MGKRMTAQADKSQEELVGSVSAEDPARFNRLRGLSGRLLFFTLAIVMLTEVFIYVPSISRFRLVWLTERLEAAQIAVLALEARPDRRVEPMLANELLQNAEVLSVALRSDERKELFLSDDMPPHIDYNVDLRDVGWLEAIGQAYSSLRHGEGRTLMVTGTARFRDASVVEIVIDETGLCQAMMAYSRNILLLSIFISSATGFFVFLFLLFYIVQPMQKITGSMIAFRKTPEDLRRIVEVSNRSDEIGQAERELELMQTDLQAALKQKTHLAALGEAVAKVNHDLRNVLTSAHLISDRLSTVDDPTVARLAPKLVVALDRAVNICVDTLKYGKAKEERPHQEKVLLHPVLSEAAVDAGIGDDTGIALASDVASDVVLYVDSDHLYRILLNIFRNAVQAFEGMSSDDRPPTIKVHAYADGGKFEIDITDNGPGIPERVREDLFKPFGLSGGSGGTGLGLSIALELAKAHGGLVELLHSDASGTSFRICLPVAK